MKNLIYLLYFITLPLYLTANFRLEFSGISLTFNFIILIIIFFYFLFFFKDLNIEKNLLGFFILILIFLVIHLINFRFYINPKIYFSYIIKLVSIIFAFYISYKVASNLNDKIHYYFFFFFFVSSIVLLYLIFRYLNLKSPALGNQFYGPLLTNTGKNQLQIYLAIVLPLNYYFLSQSENFIMKLFLIGFFIIHIIAGIYVGSRGLWVAIGLTIFIYAFIGLIKFIISLRLNKKIIFNSILILVFGIVLINISKTFETQHVIEKVKTLVSIFLYGTSNVDASVSERTYLLSFALEKIMHHPINLIAGFGLGSFQSINVYKKLTHNDYLFFLFDLGIFGLLFFLSIIFSIVKILKIKKIPLYLIVPFFLDLFFINAYNFIFFWITIGLLIGKNANNGKRRAIQEI